MVTIDIRKNVELIRNSIDEGAAKSGRQAHEIKLIAITKTTQGRNGNGHSGCW